jgi:tetratricopeptide (TPR) repeat protein
MASSSVEALIAAALSAADLDAASAHERADMLVEIAMGLQHRPQNADQLRGAVALYERAIALCADDDELIIARIRARMGTALQAIPSEGYDELTLARNAYIAAATILRVAGLPEEIAEIDLNLGLVLQTLAGAGRAKITDAIAAYQRAFLTFDKRAFPREYAILQNNLATAFLSIPVTDERARLREALAVRSFEEGLSVVTLIDHPIEYAMLQNNLGNALQYASSNHRIANIVRALDAYHEALKVRTRAAAPLEYANTIANRANALANLPDDLEHPGAGNAGNLARARDCYAEAYEILALHGELKKARLVAQALADIELELDSVGQTSSLFGARSAGGPR